MDLLLYSLYLKNLNKILFKRVQRCYSKWQFISEFCKISKLGINIKKKKSDLLIKINPPNCKTEIKGSISPIETSKRLYTNAKEIQLKKELLYESYQKIYSFTPQVKGFTGMRHKNKQDNKAKKQYENIAIVSARILRTGPTNDILRSLTPIL